MPRILRRAAAWYSLAAVVGITGTAATLNATISARQEEEARFAQDAVSAANDVADRLDGYRDLLAAMRLTFQVSPPDTEQFARFAEVFDIAHRYPGVRLLNYAPMQPSGAHPITMISPILGNEMFLGRDIAKFSGERGKAALEEARDSGKLMFSGNVIRPKGPTDKPAFSLRLPVYRGGNPPSFLPERRDAYIGSLGLGVSLDETLVNMDRVKGMRLRILDGGEATDGSAADSRKALALLWDSKTGSAPAALDHSFHRNFFMASRVWVIEATATPTMQPRVILIGGSTLTMLLALAALMLGSAAQLGTIRKLQMQQVSMKNEELLRLAAARSDFIASMSHELRTPLNAIMGFSQLLQEGWMTEERKTKAVNTIYTSGKHLLSLVNDILDLAKLEAQGMELHTEPANAGKLLEDSLYTFAAHADKHQISLTLKSTLDANVQLDVRKVRQITYNLLSNAVKFTPDGGTVTLHGRRAAKVSTDGMCVISCCAETTCEYIEITVEDSGVGMSPEGLSKLFKPFTQLQSAQAGKHAGSGLGLVLVKQLVELHLGTLAVSSVEGQGTMFRVWLPIKESDDV